MSTSHHGGSPRNRDPEQDAAIKRMLDQFEGRVRREYTKGRINAEDEGTLAYAVAADHDHKRVIINFGKHVDWIGFTSQDAVKLAEVLIAKAKEIATEPLVVNLG